MNDGEGFSISLPLIGTYTIVPITVPIKNT